MNDDDEKRDWTLGTSTASRSLDIESWLYVQHKDFVLHLLQKADKCPINRPRIPTTERERLAYIRGYVTSPFKLQIVYIQQMNFSAFFGLYVQNVIFRSLPMNYIHSFLAAYSPDEHLYASKMTPLLTGLSWQVILCGLLQLVACVDTLTIICHYCFTGFLYESPWNTCERPVFYIKPADYKYNCLDIDKFLNVTRNNQFSNKLHAVPDHVTFYANQYRLHLKNETYIFTGGPMSYYMRQFIRTSVLKYTSYEWIGYYFLMWVAAAAFYKQIFRRYIWKVLSYSQLILNFLYLATVLTIMWKYLEKEVESMKQFSLSEAVNVAMDWDCDMFAECMTGPPVVQILLSRSNHKINPGRDSALITAHNAFFYLFKGLTNYKLKQYVESLAGMPILVSWFNEFPIFYFWPFYFFHMFMGALFCRLFYIMSFIVEFMLFMVTYQLLLEVIVCEWRWARRWVATIALSVAGILLNVLLKTEDKSFLYVYCTMVASLCEAVVVFWMYPIGRLRDDMHFHNGVRPPLLRSWSLQLVPFYYIYKLLRFTKTKNNLVVMKEMMSVSLKSDFSSHSWFWVWPSVPVVIGAGYAIFKYVFKAHQKWGMLLKPRPDWGPRDHVTRQLRKQFDTRDYVGSQASRYLSRHLLIKEQTEVYRLDTRYDVSGRRSTIFTETFRPTEN